MTYLLAHDLGTSGNKAALFRVDSHTARHQSPASCSTCPSAG